VPPRYAYWTILVDEQPTAFRAADANDLQPTFKRLQQKHPSARMVWFQNGKIWNSRLDAQQAMRVRGERGRSGDFRQRKPERREGKLEWRPKGAAPRPPAAKPSDPRRARAPESRERRDRTWRPGGEHRDPRQKYKDARKAKWTRFKQNIRTRWDGKQGRKKKDEE
jgi:hypothetical protein